MNENEMIDLVGCNPKRRRAWLLTPPLVLIIDVVRENYRHGRALASACE